MSNHKVPAFDLLTEQTAPYPGFGDARIFASESPTAYVQTVVQARARAEEVFGINHGLNIESINAVEKAIEEMWTEGWNPHDADISLFTTDFGCIITEALRRSLDGSLVLRSDIDLLHASVWWPKAKIEAFPFHKAYKRLNSVDGESLMYFVERLKALLGDP